MLRIYAHYGNIARYSCMHASMDWNNLRFLLAVVREGSLRAAARRLGVDQSTLSRRIASLERNLGTRLFDRLPSGLAPTPAGARIMDAAKRIEEEVSAVSRYVMGQDL